MRGRSTFIAGCGENTCSGVFASSSPPVFFFPITLYASSFIGTRVPPPPRNWKASPGGTGGQGGQAENEPRAVQMCYQSLRPEPFTGGVTAPPKRDRVGGEKSSPTFFYLLLPLSHAVAISGEDFVDGALPYGTSSSGPRESRWRRPRVAAARAAPGWAQVEFC